MDKIEESSKFQVLEKYLNDLLVNGEHVSA